MKKRFFLWLVLCGFIVPFHMKAQSFNPYISPGVYVGYGLGKSVTFGLKLSVGLYREFNTGYQYYNLTYGVRRPISKKDSAPFKKIRYIQIQVGNYIGSSMYFTLGFGAGKARKKQQSHFNIVSTFAVGGLLFYEIDAFTGKNFKSVTDSGFLLVLPIQRRIKAMDL